MDKATLTVEEAASWIGIGRNAAYEAVKRGDLPSLRIGGRILIPRVQLERMLSGDVQADPRPVT